MVALLGLAAFRFVTAGAGPSPAGEPASPARLDSAATLQRLEAEVREQPDSARSWSQLAQSALARHQQTLDPAFLVRARAATERALKLEADQPDATLTLGAVLLSEHRFSEALDQGRRAVELLPGSATALGISVDALVELGRYREAVEASQDMVDAEPGAASYSRVSYLRELHGDTEGALRSMRQALVAATEPGADAALNTFVGDLHRNRGELDAARRAYGEALRKVEGHPLATLGLARVEVRSGDLTGARRRLEALTTRIPTAPAVALLGDVLALSGDQPAAEGQYELVRSIEALSQANGIKVDLELATFEAGHPESTPATGPRPDAVAMANAALSERPNVFASDTLAWALRGAGRSAEALEPARAAVALSTQRSSFWWHLAAIEADLGMTAEARGHLQQAFAMGADFEPLEVGQAEALAARLGINPRT